MNTALLIREASFTLDFGAPLGKEDTLTIEGSLDRSRLPEIQAGTPIGGKPAEIRLFGPAHPAPVDTFDADAPDGPLTFGFVLDGSGAYRSPVATEVNALSVGIDAERGTFVCSIDTGDLSRHLVTDEDTQEPVP